jgi:hypothetical protein
MANPDAAIACPPDSPDCCHDNHDHAAAANACPGGHDDEPCPEPETCKVWKGAIADAHHPLFKAGSHPLFSGNTVPECPGGHCHKDVAGCTVCRPLIITAPSGGYTVVQAVQA